MTRRTRIFGLFMLALLVLSGLMAAHAALSVRGAGPALREEALLVRRLELTDLSLDEMLALWDEAKAATAS